MNWNFAGIGMIVLSAALSTMPLYAVEIPVPSIPVIPDIDQTLLPDSYPVYTNGTAVLNHPEVGYKESFLPTNNKYKKNPGCYVACYSLSQAGSAYSLEKQYVVGQVRVAGSYDGNRCVPVGNETGYLNKVPAFIQLCSNSFKVCQKGKCWAGGETGGFLSDDGS